MSAITREREQGPAPEEQLEIARRRPHLVPELLLVVAVYLAYTLGRFAATTHPDGSYVHASRIWDLERWWHVPNEATVQRAALGSSQLMDLANLHYQLGYVVSVVGTLVWLYVRHPGHYTWYRRFLTLVTFIGLIGHILYPMAPPRLLAGDNVVDTAQVFGHAVYGPVGTGLSNQFAAMPSLHVGWAVVVAVGVVAVLRTPWRWLAVLHPLVTLLVVVVTGNHFWMDGIVATVIVAVSAAIAVSWLPEGKPAYAP
jgi:PAP2 superfamily protein